MANLRKEARKLLNDLHAKTGDYYKLDIIDSNDILYLSKDNCGDYKEIFKSNINEFIKMYNFIKSL